MAKINEEILVIKISTLLPDSYDMTAIMDDANIDTLRQAIEQMCGDNRTLVEIEKP